jgi:hypothetical protein
MPNKATVSLSSLSLLLLLLVLVPLFMTFLLLLEACIIMSLISIVRFLVKSRRHMCSIEIYQPRLPVPADAAA